MAQSQSRCIWITKKGPNSLRGRGFPLSFFFKFWHHWRQHRLKGGVSVLERFKLCVYCNYSSPSSFLVFFYDIFQIKEVAPNATRLWLKFWYSACQETGSMFCICSCARQITFPVCQLCRWEHVQPPLQHLQLLPGLEDLIRVLYL